MLTKTQALLARKTLYKILIIAIFIAAIGARSLTSAYARDAAAGPPPTPQESHTPVPTEDVQALYGPDCSSTAYGNNQDSSYFTDVLNLMGISVSQFALDAFAAWEPYENTTACWNPLATTYHVEWFPAGTGCTETIFNSAGVRNYSSKYCGELATARTLLYSGSGSYYKPIRDMLAQVSFDWQSLHDSVKLWVGSESYATNITNKWQTLWNNRGNGSIIPSGFNLLLSDTGVELYKKDYTGGQPNYVQVVDLKQGASVKLMTGNMANSGTGQGPFGGNNPTFSTTSLSTAWSAFNSSTAGAFCVSNGTFFSMSNPAPLAFALKQNGTLVSDGYAGSYDPSGPVMMLELWADHADIRSLTRDNLYGSSAPNILGGLSENANKSATSYVGRTFVGIDDTNGDGFYDTVLIFNSSYARQVDAATVLRNFGADKVIMLDGGGSTQLICRGTSFISSSRPIPQTIGVVAGGLTPLPPPTPTNFHIFATTDSSISLEWNDVGGETGYNIYKWGYNGSDWTFIYYDSVGANVTTYTDANLPCENDFNYYELSAYNNAGESPHVGWIQGITNACPVQTAIFRSVSTSDGYILESTETSNKGSLLNATLTTFNLGDDAGDRQYRAILSFNTADLPDNAVITNATLKIRKQGLVGTNPFTILGGLKVDISEPFFGTSVKLLASDFQAFASKSAVATFKATPVNNWYSATIGRAGYPYINLTGVTQFRLRFQKDDNDDRGPDYMKFFSGNYATASYRPTLIIEYYVPEFGIIISENPAPTIEYYVP